MFKWLKKIFEKKEVALKIPNYPEICKTLEIDLNRILELKVLKLLYDKNISRYYDVSSRLGGFPIDLIFAIHYRESSCSFLGVLHNGDEIIGTGKLTRNEPKNRGPFTSWEDAAIDALLMKKSIFPKVWTLETKLEFAEKYNGLGYRSKIGDHGVGEFSPYVFAGTNFSDETGKYWSDGKYKADAPEKQLGVAAILLALK